MVVENLRPALLMRIDAIAKEAAALERGAIGFLQTSAANSVRTYAMEKADLSDASRQELLSFLSGSEEYVPQKGSCRSCEESKREGPPGQRGGAV